MSWAITTASKVMTSYNYSVSTGVQGLGARHFGVWDLGFREFRASMRQFCKRWFL